MIVMPLASGGVGPFSPLPTSPPSSLIDYVIVTDSNNNRVQMFCIDAIAGTSQYLTQWGSSGSLHSQFKQPYGVATFPGFTGSYQYVADQENNRVQKFATILYHPAAIGPWYF
jgi:hypothetical protein